MDKPKTKLVKSKSSNSAIMTYNKSEPRKHNKKTRSNAEFQPLLLKKRGVYVEKKPTKISINERDLSSGGLPVLPNKSPSSLRPIPRPGRKRFLDSVLTILSQSTTGTQCPDQDDPDRLKRLDKTKTKIKRRKDEKVIQEETTTLSNSSKRKPRYRSKILNDNDSERDQLVVLQSTKEITHTPSNHSDKSNHYKDAVNTVKESETVKWADFLPPLVKKNLDVTPPEETKDVPVKNKDTKVLVDKDPSTIIAEAPKRYDKKFYKFFVDLLETTFSVYNVKTEFNPPPLSSVKSSKVALEIDESVAKKLNIQKIKETHDDITSKPSSKYFYYIKPDEKEHWDDKQLLEHFQPKYCKRSRTALPNKSLKKRRRLKSESFNFKKTTKKPIPVTNSLILPNKKISLKKERKKNFINLLKEQLKMEDDAFEEPQNFFQALKVIARNKRRCQKSIHFRESKKPSEGDVHVCQFKRRKLLSVSTNWSGKKSGHHPESDIIKSKRSLTRNSDTTSSSKKRTTITISETSENEVDPSQHSLEVFGFDYEPAGKKLPEDKYSPSFPPTASTSMQNYNINEALLKFSESGTSSIFESRSHITDKHGLRSLSQLME